jgi:hypothetical protein
MCYHLLSSAEARWAMPYLQLFVPRGKSESEAQAILNYLRDNFPLKQSEGRARRVAANFILFEQPEHGSLTLEQEVWLEKHGGEKFAIVNNGFLTNKACDVCKTPFEGSPTGFCPRCYATNPYVITRLILHFQPDEIPYVQFLCRSVWNTGIESPCLRIYLLAFLHLLERGLLSLEGISEASLEQFRTDARAYKTLQNAMCKRCGLLKGQCNCEDVSIYPEFDLPEIPESRNVHVPLSRDEYRNLQMFAEQHGIDVETFALCALGMPEVQLAAANREAALGRIFNYQMDLLLKKPQKKFAPAIAKIVTESFNPTIFHLVRICLSLIDAAPLLESSLLKILFGLKREAQNGQYLTRPKEQLVLVDATVAQDTAPCTSDEIKALEQHIAFKLPAVYKEFLAWMGHGAGSFLRCLDCFYPSLALLQQEAHAMLTTDACSSTLAEEAFVFALVPGEGFAYILPSEGDDPPVYAHRRVWRNMPFRKIYHRFSDFVMVQLALYAELRYPKVFQNTFGPESRRRSQEMTVKVQAAQAQKLQENQ